MFGAGRSSWDGMLKLTYPHFKRETVSLDSPPVDGLSNTNVEI
jgi:hypothetical protein